MKTRARYSRILLCVLLLLSSLLILSIGNDPDQGEVGVGGGGYDDYTTTSNCN